MAFSLTPIAFCLVLIYAQSFGELVVVRQPLPDQKDTWKLSCVSENDDGVIIWNYNASDKKQIIELQDSSSNFKPSKPRHEYSVWNSKNCAVKWESNKSNWASVMSVDNPMGPVLDYRWEGFKEFAFERPRMEQEYLYVGRVNRSSGTVVFSARGSNDVYLFLGETENPMNGRCLWIIIGGWNGTKSAIRSCDRGSPAPEMSPEVEHCRTVANVTHEGGNVIDLYEWRTFRLGWDSKQGTIEVFKDYKHEPFLKKNIPGWKNLPHVSVRSGISSRIRFHFYEYLLTDHEYAKLYTKKIQLHDENFRVNLLVGLCPECELSIGLFDENGGMVETWQFFGHENSTIHELLTWQSVKLETTLPNPDSRVVRLVIETISNKEEGKGRWAIDKFRMCNSNDGTRELILSIHGQPQPKVTCQKLLYVKNALVDPFSNMTMKNTTQLNGLLQRWKRSSESACTNFCINTFICDKTGCTCDRGLMGRNCITECKEPYHGYNCKERCDRCNISGCDKITGYCRKGCSTYGYLPPSCKLDFQTQKPTVIDVNDTTAKVLQKIELESDAEHSVSFYVTGEGSTKNRSVLQRLVNNSSTYESQISDLKPNTRYSVKTRVTLRSNEGTEQVESSEIFFTTTCAGKPRFEVLAGETNLTITSPLRGKMCEDYADLIYRIRVDEKASKEPKFFLSSWKLPLVCLGLTAYTEYEVSLSHMSMLEFSTIVRTLESAPGKPKIWNWTNQGHGRVMLKWKHPSFGQTEIKKFRIHVKLLQTNLRPDPGIKTPVAIDYPIRNENTKYSFRLSLYPSTIYNVFVVAVSEHGIKGAKSKADISVSGSVGFESDEKLQVTQSGTFLNLKAPTVSNATVDTRVSIIVKEFETCAQNHSRKSSSLANMREWIDVEYKEDQNKPEYVMIDTKRNRNNLDLNCSSNVRRTYLITVVVRDLYSDSSANRTSSEIFLIDDDNDDVQHNLIWLIIIPIIAVCLSLIWYRKREKWLMPRSRQDDFPLSSMMTSTGNSEAPRNSLHLSTLDATGNRGSIQPDVVPNNPHSYSVQIDEFEEYAKEGIASGLLCSQFALLSNESTKERKYGKLPENLSKNRYQIIIPYDETRVVLDKIPGDPHSDYINASYIKGYRKERAYIATQGPLPNTVNDFWRMVWQEKTRVICMLANVVENGKTKCEQYWPEVGTGKMYGDILVSNNDHEVFADYTIRTLSLEYQDDKRKVTHLHYTGWPDEGVPIYSQSLVAYLKKLLATPSGKGPVVVHCTAGIGRTGTIILCDICLRQAVMERMIDVLGMTIRMHEDRADMVGNIQQYFLAHLVIMESMVYEQTQISCSDGLPKKIEELRKQLPSDMQRLRDSVWQDRALHSLSVTRCSIFDNEASDVYLENLPGTFTVAKFHRDSVFDSESNYINAVSVDGVKMKKQYLESSLPSPGTISEYWRLINEKRIELILILQTPNRNDPTSCDIMSSDTIFVPVPHIRVETKASVHEEEHFTIRKFLLTDSSEEIVRQQPVTVLTCNGWKSGRIAKPPSAKALVSLWIASEKISRKETPTLVLCHDGITACGLYLALSFLLERMAVERECDVVSAVRAVRRSRTEFVQSWEQFNHLYDAAVNYFECFQTYANFS